MGIRNPRHRFRRPATSHPGDEHPSADDRSGCVSASGVVVRRAGRAVLDGLDLDLSGGEAVAVVGPSGSGKSTLLHSLCGLITVDAGTVEVAGQVTSGSSDRARAAVRLRDFGLVFQGDELLPELTLVENVSLPLRLLGQEDAMERARAELARLDIADLAQRLPSEVSGGQAQRAAVARAVVHQPTVVMADEPTSALDEVAAGKAIGLLIDLARERQIAVLLVTHDRSVAGKCERVLRMDEGRLHPATGDYASVAVARA